MLEVAVEVLVGVNGLQIDQPHRVIEGIVQQVELALAGPDCCQYGAVQP